MVPRSNASGRVSLLVPTCRFHDKIGVARFLDAKKRALDCVFCVCNAVAKNTHLPSQKRRFGLCFLRRQSVPSQKTLINVQIYALSGITWVTVAKNAPPIKLCPSNTSYVGERSSLGFVI